MASLLRRNISKAVNPRATVQKFLCSASVQVTGAAREESSESSAGQRHNEPSIPMVPKRRDPGAVLKALASTVESVEVPLYMRGRGIADPLYPRGRGYHMSYTKHMEAGKAAAQSIIEKWPAFFPDRPVDPSPAESSPRGASPLECLIAERDAHQAWSMYQTMKQDGEEVPLGVENDLLALVAYQGLDNSYSGTEDDSDVFIHWGSKKRPDRSPSGGPSPQREEGKEIKSGVENEEVSESQLNLDGSNKGSVSVWSADNAAEVMFRGMKEKDGGSYEAMIQGLIKYNRYGRAFNLFQEMRDKKFQASVETYNQLLSALKGYRVFSIALNLVKHMNSSPVVRPNITTMNNLLRISSKLDESTKTITLKVMRELFHLGLEPTLTTFVHLLVAHSSNRYGSTNPERAVILEQIVSYIENNKQVLTLREETDVVFFIQAFSFASNVSSVDLAMRLKNLAAVHGNFLVDNINYVMGIYLSTLSLNAPIETTMSEYHKIVPKITVPLEWTFRDLFEMCDKHKSPQTALELWNQTKRFMIPLTKLPTLERLCGALIHTIPAKDVHMYLEALNEIWDIFHKSGNRPSDLLITAMVQAHVLDDNIDEAWRYFQQFNKPSFLALSTLLKKYHSLGNKKKTLGILKTMAKCEMCVESVTFLKDVIKSTGASKEISEQLLQQLSTRSSGRSSGEQLDSSQEETGREE